MSVYTEGQRLMNMRGFTLSDSAQGVVRRAIHDYAAAQNTTMDLLVEKVSSTLSSSPKLIGSSAALRAQHRPLRVVGPADARFLAPLCRGESWKPENGDVKLTSLSSNFKQPYSLIVRLPTRPFSALDTIR